MESVPLTTFYPVGNSLEIAKKFGHLDKIKLYSGRLNMRNMELKNATSVKNNLQKMNFMLRRRISKIDIAVRVFSYWIVNWPSSFPYLTFYDYKANNIATEFVF